MFIKQFKYFFVATKTKNQTVRILELEQQYESTFGKVNLSSLFNEKTKDLTPIQNLQNVQRQEIDTYRFKSPYDSKFTENLLISLFSINNLNFQISRIKRLSDLKTIKVMSPNRVLFLTSAPRAYLIKGYFQNSLVLGQEFQNQQVFGCVTNMKHFFILSYNGINLNIECSQTNIDPESNLIDLNKISSSLKQIYSLLE